MERLERIRALKDTLSKLAELEREFPHGPTALNILLLREQFERELVELETSSEEAAQDH